MSLMMVAQVLGMDLQSCPRKMVLIKLADNANDKGFCWPSYEHLASHCNISRRTAMRHVEDLILTGYVKRFWRKGEEFGNRSNGFQLTLENGDISTLEIRRVEAKKAKQKQADSVVTESHEKTESHHPLVSESQKGVTECPNDRTESHPELVNELVNELVINTILSESDNLPVKSKPKKTSLVRDAFNQYPVHRRGGSADYFLKIWKQEKLTENDAYLMLNWLHHASQSDPQWEKNANGQYVKGLTKFVRERFWLTPIPMAQNKQPQSKPADFHSGDTSWADDLGEF